MQFASPQAFYLLFLIPVLLAFFAWTSKRRNRFKSVFGDETLVEKLSLRVSPARDRWKPTLLLSGLFFLVIAVARPQWGRGTEEVVARGVDIFLVLDTSFSMDAPDVAPSRMERARYIASELMERLQGNRIGLIVFSGTAFVQCPLTFDYGAARIFLDTVTTGIVPEPGTNIVAALEAAMRGFVAEGSRYKVIVLLTDGEQQSGDAVAIAEKARDDDIIIHTVGVGTPGGEPIPVRDELGNVTDYVRDSEGQAVLSRLDEETLARVALLTGGKYFRISERDREIEEIATQVAGMEGEELESQLFRRFQERFYWPLALALVFLIAETIVPRERRVSKT
ncbi:MAG TPA: VWA domain-containing protein [Vicinamibacteria bacterium]|nr:VWA domain-containing protein [Vicinamibacteria bacterium]